MADASNSITIRIGLNGGDTVLRSLQQMGEAGQNAFKSLRAAAEDVATSTDKLGTGLDNLRQKLVNVRDAVSKVGSNFKLVGGEIARVGASILGALSVNAIIGATSAWADLTGRIRNVIPATENATDVMNRLVEVANNSYQAIEVTASAYADAAKVLGEFGMSTQTSLNFFEALNTAVTLSGARGVQAESVIRGITRAMQEGSLKGANFLAVMQNGTRIMDVLAAHLNVPISKLKEMAKNGEITAKVIQDALLGSLGKLRTDLGSMDDTILDGLLKIHNAFLQWIGTVDEANGFSKTLAGLLVWVAENFDLVAKAGVAVVGVFLAIKAVKLAIDIASLAAALLQLLPALISVAATLVATPWGVMALGLAAAAVAVLALTGHLGDAVGYITDVVDKLLGLSDSATTAGSKTADAMDKANKSTQDVGKSTSKAATEIDKAADSSQNLSKNASEAVKDTKRMGEEGKKAGTGISQGMKIAAPSVQEVGRSADEAAEAFKRMRDAAEAAAKAAAAANNGGGAGYTNLNASPKMRAGGRVAGPGSSTSDSILTWLSNGEYVVRARAVQRYGLNLLHSINTMQLNLPKLARGGLALRLPTRVGKLGIPRMATGGLVAAAQTTSITDAGGGVSGRPLSLTIDGTTFDGLVAPEDVATRMAQYATNRQIRRAGKTPSWYRG